MEATDAGAEPARAAEEPKDAEAGISIPEIVTDDYGTPPDPVEVAEVSLEPADAQPIQTADAPEKDAHEMPQAV